VISSNVGGGVSHEKGSAIDHEEVNGNTKLVRVICIAVLVRRSHGARTNAQHMDRNQRGERDRNRRFQYRHWT
jgi:hypothetical protein